MFGDLQNPMSLHAFGYAASNPLTRIDPEGTASYGSAAPLFRLPSFSLPSRQEQCEKDSYIVGCMMAIQARVDGEFPIFDSYISDGCAMTWKCPGGGTSEKCVLRLK